MTFAKAFGHHINLADYDAPDNERKATGKQKTVNERIKSTPAQKINSIRKTSSIEISKEEKLMKLIPKITHIK